MEHEELVRHLTDIDNHLSVLRGRQMTNTLVLELLLLQSPEALNSLKSLNPVAVESMLQSRQMTDLAIQSAIDQLVLFRSHLQDG